MESSLHGSGPVGEYLCDIFRAYESYDLTARGASKVIWDLAPVGWLLDSGWVRTSVAPSPILADECRWQYDAGRHPIRLAEQVDRDKVFADLFTKARQCGR
jgi:hypothetical protein